MIKRNTINNIYYLLLLFYIFFNLIFKVQSVAIWGLTFALIIIELLSHNKFKVTLNDIPFMLLAICMIISSFVSPRSGEALKFSITFCCLIVMFFIVSRKKVDENFVFSIILIFSGVHVFATIFYQLFPEIWLKILPIFLSGNDLANNIYTYNIQHINCGLSPIQSANGMYITAFIMCVFTKALKNKKTHYWILSLIGFIALMLTGKRGILLAVAISLFLTYLIYNGKLNKKNITAIIKVIAFSTFLIFIGYNIVIQIFPDALRIVDRFTNQADLTTGRKDIYMILYDKYINGNVFVGNGLFSSREILLSSYGRENDAHNIYLQVLFELGIPGILIFVLIILKSLRKIIKLKLRDSDLLIIMGIFYTLVFYIYGLTGNGLFDLSIAPMWLFMLAHVFNKNNMEEGIKSENRSFNIS